MLFSCFRQRRKIGSLLLPMKPHCVRMNKGYIEGKAINVTQGSLLDQEAIVRKVDRHKRRAMVG